MPPKAITLIFVWDARKLNLIGSKNFFLLSILNKGLNQNINNLIKSNYLNGCQGVW